MPRFYFDIVEPNRTISDPEGISFFDTEHAVRQAAMIARECAAEPDRGHAFVLVLDASGQTVAKVAVAARVSAYARRLS